MILKINNKAFTLIELLSAIALISIILLGVTNINFNRLSSKQKLEIFTNNIKTSFEKIRNNSLLGRGIGASLDIPKKWKIDFSKAGSGTITISVMTDNTWSNYENVNFQKGFYISKIRCLRLDKTVNNSLSNTETGSIEISGEKLSLTGDCNNNSKILELSITNKIYTNTIQINTLNGLAELK